MDLSLFKQNHKTTFLAEMYEKLLKDEAEVLAMLSDPALKEMAEEDLKSIKEQKEGLEKQMNEILDSEKEEIEFPAEMILEVRAGAGGEEAALFAEELLMMYKKYAESIGWNVKIIEESKSPLGGYKEVSLQIKGKDSYKKLRYETGVHRIQRVPETEKMGRVHTSTVSVSILPIRKKTSIEIKPTDLHIEFSRSGGKGGQNVNKVESAVRIVHIPTNIDVRSTAERSQAANKERAMTILTAKLEVLKEEEEAKKWSSEKKSQIGTGDRSEKIRTYNILQDRITDHRIKQTWHNIEIIFAGKIQPILDALEEYEKTGIAGNDPDFVAD
ncbi:MAG: PCRF domain-containing protein [bacterium]|nr:PCRF domain-containing protein [bacterium]